MAKITPENYSLTDDFKFSEEYLPRVSRTFAINIKVLNGDAYRGVLLAYLLCRIADTFEDDHHFPVNLKIEKLHEYSGLFPPGPNYQSQISKLLNNLHFHQETDYATLSLNTLRVFNELVRLPDPLIAAISKHVQEMALGMADFQAKGLDQKSVFFENQSELDRYCYFVAGTVGLMITSIFSATSNKISSQVKQKLESRSVPFGLGLQVTNIAKDFAEDQKRGWCYVPRSFFIEEGIDPLTESINEKPEGLFQVEKRIIRHALGYLDEALKYITDLPRTLIRYRLFCLWPLFMAAKTLGKLYHEHAFFAGRVTKISRDDVRNIIRNTSMVVISNHALRFLYNNIKPIIR